MHSLASIYRHGLIALIAIAVVIAGPEAAAQAGLGLAPMRVELRATPGTQRSGTLTVSVDAAATMRIRSEIDDFLIDATSNPQFERSIASEADTSCRSWLSLNPMEMEGTPGQQIPVRYTIRIPANAPAGSYHCAAGFTTLPVANESGTGLRTAVRVIAALYVVVGEPAMQGKLKEILVEAVKGPDPNIRQAAQPEKPEEVPVYQAVVVIQNSGRMHFRPIGTVELLGEDGVAIEHAELPSVPALPSRDLRLVIPLKTDLSKGTYKLRARVDIGAGEIEEGSVTVGTSGKK
jgi:hypothetical protein